MEATGISATAWSISGRQVRVNNTPFFANGVSYSPVPWGSCPGFEPFGDFTITTWQSIWSRDLALMRANGVNLLKTYNTLDVAQLKAAHIPITDDHDHGPFLEACWNGGTKPVFVLMGYAPPAVHSGIFQADTWNDGTNPAAREQMKADLVALAQEYGSSPAVMGFVMANEINNPNTVQNPDFWKYWNDVAAAITAVAPGKLTSIANVDDSMDTPNAGGKLMTDPSFFWGINSYRGNWLPPSANFDILFSTFASASPKPLMITEWGAPATTHDASGSIAPMSAEQMTNLKSYVTGHYNDLVAHASDTGTQSDSVCCGGAYFEWTDELWKSDPAGQRCNEQGAAPACHTQIQDPGQSPNAAFPGGFGDEEAFGLFSIAPDTSVQRVPVVPGGCTGPWNPVANAPYPPDKLGMREHASALFQLFHGRTAAAWR